ncbi:unnamed protein product, partial [Polarella glacialis]
MMLMVVAPGGIQDWSFWILVAVLNVSSLASNAGLHHSCWAALRRRSVQADPPLKVLFDAKIAVQDQLADVVSLMIVPAIATSFHICTSLNMAQYPRGALVSLWQRFGVLLVARLLSGVLTEEIFRRRVELLNKADSLELQLLPIDESQRRQRYMNDIDVGPTLAVEATRNIERCELYFAAVAVACTFAVLRKAASDPVWRTAGGSDEEFATWVARALQETAAVLDALPAAGASEAKASPANEESAQATEAAGTAVAARAVAATVTTPATTATTATEATTTTAATTEESATTTTIPTTTTTPTTATTTSVAAVGGAAASTTEASAAEGLTSEVASVLKGLFKGLESSSATDAFEGFAFTGPLRPGKVSAKMPPPE